MFPSLLVFGFPALFYPQVLVAAFMAVLFLQSGLDKAFNYRGNLDYFRDHFKNSPLAPTVGLLMPVITALELGAGAFSAAGLPFLLLGNAQIAWWGQLLAGMALLALFFGQRMAKDYAGAATLVPYFLLALAGLWILSL